MKTWIMLAAIVLTFGAASGAFAGSSVFTPPLSAQLAPTPSPEAAGPAPGAFTGGSDWLAGWDVSLDGRVGVPSGSVRVGEKPVKGTELGLHNDLGMAVSEVLEASLGYHLTPRDAIRLTYLQYFLNGSTTINQSFTYNGQFYDPGRVTSSLGFNWLSLAYERVLFALPNGGSLTGSAGVRYVSLDAVVRGNHEDFYRQELPVPIVGLRLIYPIDQRWALTADVSGGGLPRVDSLRQEGGTVYLNQTHADGGVSLTYAITPTLQAHAGYHLTYFLQHEKSHEDDNRFELIDNGLQFGLNFRF